ncbi:MAG: cadherin-like beta sandwich domain-containing protein, partial [Sphingobacteriales bacterium]
MIKPLPFNIRFLWRIVCLVAVLTSYFNATNAQQAYLTAGGNANGAGGSASYSVGQTAYMFNKGANGNVQQGVQQPAFAPNDATLSNLAVVGATISPTFDAATTVYTSSVSASVASITVTPTATEASTTITYNNTPVTSGLPITVPLVNGSNIIPFIVTAAGGNTKTYTLTITKTVPPTVDYGTAHIFALDEPISPVTPSNTNVGALGYNAPAAIGKSIGSGFIKA